MEFYEGISGDIETNIEKTKGYCEYVVKTCGEIPICPHIYFTQFLDDTNNVEREFGLKAGLLLLSECDELYYFGDIVSRGMAQEIAYAKAQGISVKYIPLYEYEHYMQNSINSEEMIFNV